MSLIAFLVIGVIAFSVHTFFQFGGFSQFKIFR